MPNLFYLRLQPPTPFRLLIFPALLRQNLWNINAMSFYKYLKCGHNRNIGSFRIFPPLKQAPPCLKVNSCRHSQPLYQVDEVPFCHWFVESPYHAWQLHFVKCIFIHLLRWLFFFHSSIYYNNWFLKVKLNLYYWDKSHLVMVDNPFEYVTGFI